MTSDDRPTRRVGPVGPGALAPANRRLLRALGWIVVCLAFLATRLVFLDGDVPPWPLSQYSPIDEFTYVLPAFNLQHFGTWTHQAAPYAPVEGWPMNVAQTLVTAVTLEIAGSTYWGLRGSSVLFGLMTFGLVLAIARRQVLEATAAGVPRAWGTAILVGVAGLLVLDFSFLLAGRIVEPTVARLAGIALVLWLVARGTFLGSSGAALRSVGLGAIVGALVWLVYVYNVFVVPAAFVALLLWARRTGNPRDVARHAAAYILGLTLASVGYFVAVRAVYGQTPIEWYRVWIAFYDNSSRVSGASLTNLWSILEANIFRLDRAFMALFLLSLPVYVWRTARTMRPWMTLVVACLGCLLAQSTFVADYPIRKFLVLLLLAVPVGVSGLLWMATFRGWVSASPFRLAVVAGWVVLVMVVTASLLLPEQVAASFYRFVGEPQLEAGMIRRGLLGLVVLSAGWVGLGALAALLVVRSRRLASLAALILATAIAAPLASVDLAQVFGRPTWTYRDALISARNTVDGRSTAGSWSVGMQLYNTSVASLSGYHYGQSQEAYVQAVVRVFEEGRADAMFDYTDGATRERWEALGFRLVETYDIRLPRDQALGRYVFTGGQDSDRSLRGPRYRGAASDWCRALQPTACGSLGISD